MYVYSYLLPFKFLRKAQGICIKMVLEFSRMCMCIDFIIQVLKQKNAQVSFPVGMAHQQVAQDRTMTIRDKNITKLSPNNFG